MSLTGFNYGSIIVDGEAIRRRGLPLVGKAFRISWDELTSWSVQTSVMPSMDTGTAEVLCDLVELSGPAGMEQVDRKAANDQLDSLVAYLRLKCPEKESKAQPAEP